MTILLAAVFFKFILMLPITEKVVSKNIGRTIKSPIHLGDLEGLGINQKQFVKQFSKLFKQLSWDDYDSRRLRVEFLKEVFPKETKKIDALFKKYFLGKIDLTAFAEWTTKLTKKQRTKFKKIKPWRRRSVSKFKIKDQGSGYHIERVPVPKFKQSVKSKDYRSWGRIFDESPAAHVDNFLFYQFLIKIFKLIKTYEPKVKSADFTAHFMSVKSTSSKPGDNSPEGAHEDGATYIVSALVINRKNVKGGKTQILEKLNNGKKEIILNHTLQPGEFAFQADTNEELTFGNDLWHHVTPFSVKDQSKGKGWRDIIGFDIVI